MRSRQGLGAALLRDRCAGTVTDDEKKGPVRSCVLDHITSNYNAFRGCLMLFSATIQVQIK